MKSLDFILQSKKLDAVPWRVTSHAAAKRLWKTGDSQGISLFMIYS